MGDGVQWDGGGWVALTCRWYREFACDGVGPCVGMANGVY